MFGIGMPELIIILVIGLVVIGPKKLPEMARSLGKGLDEFKRASNDFRRNIEEEARAAEEKEQIAGDTAVKAASGSDKAQETVKEAVCA